MKSMLLDTSVYGELATDEAFLRELAKNVNTFFIVFGSEVVNGELQKVSADKKIREGKFKGMNLRGFLMTLYSFFVRKSENLQVTALVEIVAAKYYLEYSKEAAKTGRAKLEPKLNNDFKIVASASLRGADILVTCDVATMLRPEAIRAYKNVNTAFQLKAPLMLTYEDFKRQLPEIIREAGDESE